MRLLKVYYKWDTTLERLMISLDMNRFNVVIPQVIIMVFTFLKDFGKAKNDRIDRIKPFLLLPFLFSSCQ